MQTLYETFWHEQNESYDLKSGVTETMSPGQPESNPINRDIFTLSCGFAYK